MEIIARITADAKVSTLNDERQVVNFSVAINDSYKVRDSKELKKVVTFVQCSYWKNSSIAKHLTKGMLVELYGRIGVNAYKDMQGEAKARITLHVSKIKLHGKSKQTMEENTTVPESVSVLNESTDDLPF